MLIEPPAVLPVAHLSVSSIRTFLQCPERWRRRYMLGEYEPTGVPALVGSALHRAEGESYQHRIDTGLLRSTADVVDTFSDAFDLGVETASAVGIDWEDERPGKVKDNGIAVLRNYHRHVAPTVRPLNVERRYELAFVGVEWTFNGYLDLEVDAGRGRERLADLKSRSTTKGIIGPAEAAADLQVTANLYARRAEGQAADGFDFHNLVRAKPGQLTPKHVVVTPAHRTDDELDAFAELVMRVAAMIRHCVDNDAWTAAPPGAWWCSDRFCGFWRSCPFGGLHRSVMFNARPLPARPVTDSLVVEAVERTLRRDGTTTAARVANYLGIPQSQAVGRLTHSPRVASATPTKTTGRGDKKVTVELPGPKVYRLVQHTEVVAA